MTLKMTNHEGKIMVETDGQGLTTHLKAAGMLKPGDLFLGRRLSDGTIILEPCKVVAS